MRWQIILWANLCGILLHSCGSSQTGSPAGAASSAGKILALDEASGADALEKKFAKYDQHIVKDEAGNIQKESKRSQFDGRQLTEIGGNWGKKEYTTSRYSKKTWTGSQKFDHKKFSGNSKNRWDGAEWFLKKQAQESHQASEARKNYTPAKYSTQNAHEQSRSRIAKTSNTIVDSRKRVFQQPLIIDDEAYEKMSLNESKVILGRE